MGANLFVIEAPGKRRGLFEALRRVGVREVAIEATVGHLCANPESLKPMAINSAFQETAYRIRPDREQAASSIAAAAVNAARIYLATDDDQEGDVIARDAYAFCIPDEHRHKVRRLRLKSLADSEIIAALKSALPFDPSMASQGDARRIVDRLIGGLSSPEGGVGRVQGSLLLALKDQRPVVGVVTHTLAASDGRGPFIAQQPVFGGHDVPDAVELQSGVGVATSARATLAARPMNHDEIVLTASLRTGADIGDISRAMQSLYERGRLSYPRAKDCALSADSVRRLAQVARGNGATFRSELFRGVRELGGAHAHEAPNPMVLDVPVNRSFDLMTLEEQVLVTITQNLIEAGIEARVETPRLEGLPAGASGLAWRRLVPVGVRIWEPHPAVAGFQGWTAQQSLVHFMMKNQLGRPSTLVAHIDKFLTRELVTQAFDLTAKGRDWAANVERHFGGKNLSAMVEKYIEDSKSATAEIVDSIVESFGLQSVRALCEDRVDQLEHENHEDPAFFPGDVSGGR